MKASTDVDINDIRKAIQELNDAWCTGRPEETVHYLHEEVTFVPPGFAARVKGRDACVQSYVDFVRSAEILSFEAEDASVDIGAQTAVAEYAFSISYRIGDRRYDEAGRDLFVFTRSGGRWQAVWRAVLQR